MIRAYVTPTLLFELRAFAVRAGDAALIAALDDPPRHRMQHRYGVPVTATLAGSLAGMIAGWEEQRATATGRGPDGRSALTRLITEGRDVLRLAGMTPPPEVAPAVVRLTPRLFDTLAARPLPPDVRAMLEGAHHHAESHKWEIVIPPSADGAFRATLEAVRADVDARHSTARGVEKSALGWLRRELSALDAAPVPSPVRGKIVAPPVSAHALRGERGRMSAPVAPPPPPPAPPVKAPKPRAPRLPADLIAALGFAPDAEIAARFGTTTTSVRQARMSRDIPAYTAVRERSIEAVLAAHPDWSMRAVARELGVAVTTVTRAAERLQAGRGRSQTTQHGKGGGVTWQVCPERAGSPAQKAALRGRKIVAVARTAS